jgi:hypothetical protein
VRDLKSTHSSKWPKLWAQEIGLSRVRDLKSTHSSKWPKLWAQEIGLSRNLFCFVSTWSAANYNNKLD